MFFSVSYSFLINGEAHGTLIPGRRLRHPVSQYLFVICAHGLFEMILDHKCRNLFKWVSIAPNFPFISHLFFTDDNLIFCRAKSLDCLNLKYYLDYDSLASGQAINFDKSALSFSPNTTRLERESNLCNVWNLTSGKTCSIFSPS